jgi:predicted RNA methylase
MVLEVLSGVADFTRAELQRHLPAARVLAVRETEVEVDDADLDAVRRLRTVVAAYLTLDFPIRKPRELLSSDRVKAVGAAFDEIRRQRPRQRFHSMRFSMAGAHSPEMSRFREELSGALNLPEEPESGELLIRVRKHPETAALWQVLLRTTPRPLSARPWRVVNYPGAVNATIAAAVVDALEPRPDDEVIDLMCGSGTLVLERLARCGVRRMVACDISPVAIDAAEQNQRAARLKGAVEYHRADFRSLERDDPGFGTLMANPPWGELVGSHQENDVLYADLLETAHRLAAERARFGVLTHDIRRFESVLAADRHWSCRNVTRFFQKGHHPRLYVLEHRAGPVGGSARGRDRHDDRLV